MRDSDVRGGPHRTNTYKGRVIMRKVCLRRCWSGGTLQESPISIPSSLRLCLSRSVPLVTGSLSLPDSSHMQGSPPQVFGRPGPTSPETHGQQSLCIQLSLLSVRERYSICVAITPTLEHKGQSVRLYWRNSPTL